MADKVLVREMGTKFIVGFCGANLHVVLLELRTKGNVLEAKIGFVALFLSSAPPASNQTVQLQETIVFLLSGK